MTSNPKEPAGLPDETLGNSANSIARETAQLRLSMEYAVDVGRSEADAEAALLKSCGVARFAAEAFYTWGEHDDLEMFPSVRLAREAARCWGHIRYGFRLMVVASDRVQLQGWAWDLRTGAYAETEASFDKVVERVVDGQLIIETVGVTDAAMRGMVNKHGAMAERSALLKVLPPWFVDSGLQRALEAHAKAERDEIDEKMGKLLHGFAQLQVDSAQVYKYLGTKPGSVESNHLIIMRGVLNSILDGSTDVGQFFTVPQEPERSGSASAAAKPTKATAKPKGPAKRSSRAKPKKTLEAAVVSEPGEGDGAELAAVLGERGPGEAPDPWDENEDGLSLLGDALS